MRLSDCFIELIAYVAYFLKSHALRQPAYDQVRAEVVRRMDLSRERLDERAFSAEEYDAARFAVCAWIDEAILSSEWPEKLRWQGEPLQRVYYGTTEAGELFFERLNTVGPHQHGVREVYYLCLAMGFSGRYCNRGDELLLEQLKTSNLKILTASSMGLPTLEGGVLFPEAYPEESALPAPPKADRRFSLFTAGAIGVPLALYGVIYLIYHFVLGSIGKGLIGMVP